MSTAKLRLLFLDDEESPMLKWFPGPRTAQKSGVWPLMSTSRCGPISSFFSQKTGLLFWPKMSFFLATARTRPFSQNVLLAPPKLSSFFLYSRPKIFSFQESSPPSFRCRQATTSRLAQLSNSRETSRVLEFRQCSKKRSQFAKDVRNELCPWKSDSLY